MIDFNRLTVAGIRTKCLALPIVLNALGNQSHQTGGGINIGNIAGILSNFVGNQQQQQAPQQNDLITQLLDRDKDGSVVDDVVGMLGNLFKK